MREIDELKAEVQRLSRLVGDLIDVIERDRRERQSAQPPWHLYPTAQPQPPFQQPPMYPAHWPTTICSSTHQQ